MARMVGIRSRRVIGVISWYHFEATPLLDIVKLAATFATGSFSYRLQQLPGFPSTSVKMKMKVKIKVKMKMTVKMKVKMRIGTHRCHCCCRRLLLPSLLQLPLLSSSTPPPPFLLLLL